MKRACLIAVTALAVPFAFGSGSDYKPPPASGSPSLASGPYEKGRVAAMNGKYFDAEKYFMEALRADARSADAYNMLAYCQRQEGKTDAAFQNYRKALSLRPRFPQAREYLGEAHIQAAVQEIKILKSYGPDGAEQLQNLVQALKEAAAGVE